MGMFDPNALVGIINGKIGNLVFARTKDGRVIVRQAPVRVAAFTGPELVNQTQFAQAAAYVRKVKQQVVEYAVYQSAAKLRGKRACDLAHADLRHAPLISRVDLHPELFSTVA